MTRFVTGFAAALGLMLSIAVSPTPASADPMPAGARPADYAQLTRLYAGKTDLWSENCNGGIYYGANSQARAWCADSPDSLGAGRWTIEANGLMCQSLTWYYPSGNRAGASAGERTCISHVVDRRGNIWRSWPDSSEWWPANDGTSLVPGYRMQENVRRTQRRLGL